MEAKSTVLPSAPARADARPRRDDGAEIRRPYCLRCYAALERERKASTTCPACGFVNVALDQRTFWTKEPRFVRLEAAAKLAIVALLALISYGIVAFARVSFGTGQGWAIGLPIVAGAVLWQTAEKITRWKPYFRATLFYGTIPLILALPILVAALWPSRDVPLSGRAIALAIVIVFVAFALAVRALCLRLARWRDRRILSGQT